MMYFENEHKKAFEVKTTGNKTAVLSRVIWQHGQSADLVEIEPTVEGQRF